MISQLALKAATTIGIPLQVLEEQGDRVRSGRRRGWLADERWTVPADTGLAGLIDHTLLLPDATQVDTQRLCQEALKYGFPSVCVNPVLVAEAVRALAGSQVRVAAVVGFPLGATTTLAKTVEATECIARGARELDMVINVGGLKDGVLPVVMADIAGVVRAAADQALVKVIVETALLTQAEKVVGCLLAKWAGADYVKTSTGFGTTGATAADVSLLRAVVGDLMGVKASGGIRDSATARLMVSAGASRIGTSRGPAIVSESV